MMISCSFSIILGCSTACESLKLYMSTPKLLPPKLLRTSEEVVLPPCDSPQEDLPVLGARGGGQETGHKERLSQGEAQEEG